MARYQYVILSRAKPGHEEAFRRWYAEQHLADVVRHPDVLSGRLFVPEVQKDYDLGAPDYTLLTIYELETDDPAATIESIKAQSGTALMPATDALDKAGMLQVVATQIAQVG